jgi:hypothetical protein
MNVKSEECIRCKDNDMTYRSYTRNGQLVQNASDMGVQTHNNVTCTVSGLK